MNWIRTCINLCTGPFRCQIRLLLHCLPACQWTMGWHTVVKSSIQPNRPQQHFWTREHNTELENCLSYLFTHLVKKIYTCISISHNFTTLRIAHFSEFFYNGMGVTKAPFINISTSKMYDLCKSTCWIHLIIFIFGRCHHSWAAAPIV